jgi:hypothetical protein
MNKSTPTSTATVPPTCPATVFCGIDVSAGSLAVAWIEPDHSLCQREFANSASGHSELVLLPPGMTVRQWVAYSGLDPMHQESGSSVHKPSRISRAGNRHLRRALYMPTLSAVRHDPHLRAFYQALRERHKTGLHALMAVARKLLHAIYGIFKSGRPYDGNRLFPQIQLAVESIAG